MRLVRTTLCAVMLALTGAQAHALSDADQRTISGLNSYLNSITHAQGKFVQNSPDGTTSGGDFYLRRPGRARFEYAPPSNLLVVADGTWIIVQEDSRGPAQRYPLGLTPLGMMLDDQVDLTRDSQITAMESNATATWITLRDPDSPQDGSLTLVFDAPEPRLRQWSLVDAQGLRTTVTLSSMVEGIRAANELFRVDESVEERR